MTSPRSDVVTILWWHDDDITTWLPYHNGLKSSRRDKRSMHSFFVHHLQRPLVVTMHYHFLMHLILIQGPRVTGGAHSTTLYGMLPMSRATNRPHKQLQGFICQHSIIDIVSKNLSACVVLQVKVTSLQKQEKWHSDKIPCHTSYSGGAHSYR